MSIEKKREIKSTKENMAVEDQFCLSILQCLEQINGFNELGKRMKKIATLLITMKDWHSIRCNLSWKIKFTNITRLYVQLQASRVTIKGHFLPTPTASEGTRGSGRKLSVENGKLLSVSTKGVRYGISLQQIVEQGFLPTPICSDAAMGAIIGKHDEFRVTSGLPRKFNKNGKDGSVGLARLVNLLSDFRRSQDSRTIKQPALLNPCFVMEMMGFLPTWTLMPFLNSK